MLAALLVFACAFFAHREINADGFWLTALIGLAGISLGWLLGFLASPQSEKEETRFQGYAKVLTAALSGYFLSKMEPLIQRLLEAERLLASPLHGIRLLVFIALVLIAAITMFVYRSYLFRRRESSAQ